MNNLLVTLVITFTIIIISILFFYLGYLYGKISERQTKYKKDEREEIPETLKGKAYDYMTQMKTLIKNQHTMSPDLFIANAMSIVCYAYSAGVDFVVDTLKLEKKGEE